MTKAPSREDRLIEWMGIAGNEDRLDAFFEEVEETIDREEVGQIVLKEILAGEDPLGDDTLAAFERWEKEQAIE